MLLSDKLRVVMTASESIPFSKTGGLADVSSALAKALDELGHDVTLIIPDYRQLRFAKRDQLPTVTDTGLRFSMSLNGRYITGGVNWTILPDSNVKVFLVSQPDYFDRPQLYMENGEGLLRQLRTILFLQPRGYADLPTNGAAAGHHSQQRLANGTCARSVAREVFSAAWL